MCNTPVGAERENLGEGLGERWFPLIWSEEINQYIKPSHWVKLDCPKGFSTKEQAFASALRYSILY